MREPIPVPYELEKKDYEYLVYILGKDEQSIQSASALLDEFQVKKIFHFIFIGNKNWNQNSSAIESGHSEHRRFEPIYFHYSCHYF